MPLCQLHHDHMSLCAGSSPPSTLYAKNKKLGEGLGTRLLDALYLLCDLLE